MYMYSSFFDEIKFIMYFTYKSVFFTLVLFTHTQLRKYLCSVSSFVHDSHFLHLRKLNS